MSYLLLLSIFFIPYVFADDLAAIEVKAEKRSTRFGLNDTTIISIEEKRDSTLAPLLESVSGTVVTQDGGPGGRTSFFIRGTEARHVSFTLDGLRLNDSSNTDRQFDSAFFTSAFLSDVEVHKGPSPVLFGSDALGGQVEMRSRKGENAPEARIDVNAGSFGTIDTSLGKDWKKNGHQGTLTFSRFHTDGISRLNRKRFKAKEKDAADITQITSSSRHKWQKKWESDFLASYVHGKNELDGMTSDNSKDRSKNDQYVLQQKTHYKLNTSTALSLRNGLNRHQREITTLASGRDRYNGNYYQNEFLYQKEFKRLEVMSGVGTEKESLKNMTLDKSLELHSLFLQGLVKTNYLKYQLGGRWDHHSRYGDFQTGSVGASYFQGENEIGIQYAQGFKAPSVYQLYGPSLFGFPVGNKHLVPERNHNLELNLKTQYLNVSFFQNRLKNLITYTNGYQNQGDFIAEGIEVAGKVRNEDWQFSSSFTHQEFKKAEEAVLRRPKNSAQAKQSYFFKKIELFVRGKWFDARKDKNPQGQVVKLSSYEVVDVGAKYSFSQSDIGVQVLNIFDRGYENLYGQSVMPLSVFFHYGVRL